MAGEINWQKSLKNALGSAGNENKLLLVDFYSPT